MATIHDGFTIRNLQVPFLSVPVAGEGHQTGEGCCFHSLGGGTPPLSATRQQGRHSAELCCSGAGQWNTGATPCRVPAEAVNSPHLMGVPALLLLLYAHRHFSSSEKRLCMKKDELLSSLGCQPTSGSGASIFSLQEGTVCGCMPLNPF